MNPTDFLMICIFSLVFAFVAFMFFKQKGLQKTIAQQESQISDSNNCNIPGFSQEVWNSLTEELIDSSDDMMLLFDGDMKLRLWNKTAQSVHSFERGVGIEELELALEPGSQAAFKNLIKQVSSKPKTAEKKLKMNFLNGPSFEKKVFVQMDSSGELKALSLSGALVTKRAEPVDHDTLETKALRGIKTPLADLLDLDLKLQGELTDVEGPLPEIQKMQREALNCADAIVSHATRKKGGLSRQAKLHSFKTSSLLKNLKTLIELDCFSLELECELEGLEEDSQVLVDKEAFIAYAIDYLKAQINHAKNLKVTVHVNLIWKNEPMEVLVGFELKLSQLGQPVGGEWAKRCLADHNMFVDFESKFALKSLQLMRSKEISEGIKFSVILPRDISV